MLSFVARRASLILPASAPFRTMATIKHVHSDNAPKAIGPYSQAIVSNGIVWVSGQLPMHHDTMQLSTGTIQEQTKVALGNMRSILEAAGTNLAHVVKVNVYLKNMGDFASMNEAYAEVFGDARPARAAVEVARLPRDAQIEIECTAVIPSA